MNICPTCHLDFGSVGAFDEHRVGEHDYLYREGLDLEPPRYDGRRCLDVTELEAMGWKQDRYGRWRTPAAFKSVIRR